ncbi:MAG TPA: DEAD/DEAH box helicase, partial [Candidatus Dormibacteraeota bacterium]|nr:DEAD/DEAH box helicase [Candidatus Dormibacteraeota bacterium]
LHEFRARLGEAGDSLEREVIRYADLVAATCLSCGTSPLLAHEEFDLAIVDEAGQVSVPNLLVAAVKARRMVLVGDHKQLPPFLDEDVRRWANQRAREQEVPDEETAEIRNMLDKSAFERLYDIVDEEHRDMLKLQRRMPMALSEFVSEAFYGGRLRCDHTDRDADPLFRSRLALIDTGDRPPAERGEGSADDAEAWSGVGAVNLLEARLIAELVARYMRWQADWGVIVPYRAQVELVRRMVADRVGGAARAAESINTVDAFQGGERDFMVYGFTRSNEAGDVGFLSELRRLNVALTRARQQLVLVGDASMLLQARDRGFASLMAALKRHLTKSGEVLPSREFEARLRDSAAQP